MGVAIAIDPFQVVDYTTSWDILAMLKAPKQNRLIEDHQGQQEFHPKVSQQMMVFPRKHQ